MVGLTRSSAPLPGHEGDFGPVRPPDILRMILLEGAVLNGDSDVFEGDVPGIGAGDAVGAGEIEVAEGDISDRAFFKSFYRAARPGVAGRDMIDVDLAKHRGALGQGFLGSSGVTQGEHDGVADILESNVGSDDVFDDATPASGALDSDAVVGAVTVAIEEAHVADPG